LPVGPHLQPSPLKFKKKPNAGKNSFFPGVDKDWLRGLELTQVIGVLFKQKPKLLAVAAGTGHIAYP